MNFTQAKFNSLNCQQALEQLREDYIMFASQSSTSTSHHAVANTQHGIDYQVHLAAFFGLFYALDNNVPMQLVTEAEGHGKFDDLVITLPSGVIAIQCKHHLDDDGAYTLGSFMNKSSIVALYRYFDSVFELLPNPPAGYNLCFLSNHQMPSELAPFIDLATGKFNGDFWSSCFSPYSKIYSSIVKHSEKIKRLSEDEHSLYINNFLVLLQFQFGFYPRDNIKSQIKQILQRHYHTQNDAIYHALFHAFYDWSIRFEPQVLTNTQIKNWLDDQYAVYVILEQLCGLTKGNLQTATHITLPRAELTSNLAEHLRTKKFVMLQGPSGIGKSQLIINYLKQQNPIEGSVIFVNISQLKFIVFSRAHIDMNRCSTLKQIIIDDADQLLFDTQLQEKMVEFIKSLPLSCASVVLLVKGEYATYVNNVFLLENIIFFNYTVPMLTEEEIRQVNPAVLSAFEEPLRTTFRTQLLSIPFYLNLAVKTLAQLSTINQSQLSAVDLANEMIRLLVGRGDGKKRLSLLRRMIYTKNSDVTGRGAIILQTDDQACVQSLIDDGILTWQNNVLTFSHYLFERWTVNRIMHTLMKVSLEAKDTPCLFVSMFLYRLQPCLSDCASVLQDSQKFKAFLKTTDGFNENLSNLNNLAFSALRSNNNSYVHQAFNLIYENCYADPRDALELFEQFDFECEDHKKFVRGNHTLFDILESISDVPETFCETVGILCCLAGDYSNYNSDYVDRIVEVFSPGLSGVTLQQRIQYLENNIVFEEESIHLLKALYHIINEFSLKETSSSLSFPSENDPEYADFIQYGEKAVDILINAANSGNEDAAEMLQKYFEENLGNLLADAYTEMALVKILTQYKFELTSFESGRPSFSEGIMRGMQSDLARQVSRLEKPGASARIDYFPQIYARIKKLKEIVDARFRDEEEDSLETDATAPVSAPCTTAPAAALYHQFVEHSQTVPGSNIISKP